MTPERWYEINQVFTAAAELEPNERAAYLDQTCGDDHALRKEVESLLASEDGAWDLIEKPALEKAAPFLGDDRQQLEPGQNFSHYEIVRLIGKGGMGEVYLAADKLLNRKIALKLLPADYTADKERLRRFEQEAQAASALNHPNILTIHEIGEENGQKFIATEFVDGETLRQRLNGESLTLGEMFEIAIQIAGALSAAHQAGIVHRDIKPENIMLRPDGYVKVLDFGLAKLTEQSEAAPHAGHADTFDASSGLVMGTVKYMSPEQAQGQKVDPRSDIFSFGVVLYEMLVGRAPFEGKGGELVSAILKKEPSLANIPDALQPLIRKALSKRKEERYQTMLELLLELRTIKEKLSVGGIQSSPHVSARSATSPRRAVVVSTSSTVEYIVSGIKRHKASTTFVLAGVVIVAVSFALSFNRIRRLRASAELRISRIPNTDKGRSVAISPDGQYMAYAEMTGAPYASGDESLWVIQVTTNNHVQIAPPANIDYESLTYSRDGGSIFYVNDGVLYSIPASGGSPAKHLTNVGAISFSPDGTQVAFVREGNALVVANLDGSGERVIATRKSPEFINPGGTAWSPDGGMIACGLGTLAKNRRGTVVGFDVTTGTERRITDQTWDEVGGQMVWLPDGSALITAAVQGAESHIWKISYPSGEAQKITSDPNWEYSSLSLTADGKNLFALESAFRSAVWIMPNGDPGKAKPITSGEHESYRHVSWTPDGRILYASNVAANRDVWMMNADGSNPTQITANADLNLQPDVSPDGRYIVVSSNRTQDGAYNLWRVDIDGKNPLRLTHGRGEGQPRCSPDGRWVVYAQGGPNTGPLQKTLWKVPIDGGEPVQLVDRPSMQAAFSPDGTLIACWYKPDSASPFKIALIPSAGGPPVKLLDVKMTSKAPIHWSPDGQAIYYVKASPFLGNIWSQPISGGAPTPITQFTSERLEGFDVSRDGKLICARGHNVQNAISISNFR